MGKPVYQFFTAREIKPSGWFRKQLELQAGGLCGNLDKVWPDIRDSRWIGGSRDGWERVPYWLDGFIPLAHLLDDEDLKQRARIYINAILDRQKPDGWICPCADNERAHYDVWAAFLICKVLVLYHDCTGDDRIPGAVYRALYCLNLHLEKYALLGWGAARWYECLIPLMWLYKRNPENWMIDFAVSLKFYGMDYETLFKFWRFDKPQERGRWNFSTHVVNLAMCLKSEALFSSFMNEECGDFARKALQILLRDHGMPIGHFSGDECLSGRSPVQGTELCGVVEAMYSYEWLFALSADDAWVDRLEKLAFNALPAAISTDMWSHQYDQMTNQIQCTRLEAPHFMTNTGDAHLFGLEPHYGCCTANFGQGWPKLTFAGIMKTDEGLAIGAIVPCKLNTVIKGSTVSCEIVTNYPFEDGYLVIITAAESVSFSLSLRFPEGAKNITVNGESIQGTRRHITGEWHGRTEIAVAMDFTIEMVPHSGSLYFVRRGNVVYALPVKSRWEKLEYTKDGVERKFPYCDYELIPQSDWNYAFSGCSFVLKREESSGPFFDPAHVPVKLKTQLVPINWPLVNGVADSEPDSHALAESTVEAELIPYGCTDLRMTLLPLAT
jgi:hypothetical protein